MGGDRNARDRLKGHQWYDACEAFCSRWDQVSFDPDYPTRPLEVFEPLVRGVFSREAHDPRYESQSALRGNANEFTKRSPALEHVAVAQIACSAAPERV
jgi:predicted HD phosphohydrolase